MHLRLIALVTLVCASGSSFESDSSESRILNVTDLLNEAEDAISSSGVEDFSDVESVPTGLREQVDSILEVTGDLNDVIKLLETSRDHHLVRSIASDVLYKAALFGDRAIVKKLVLLGATIGLNILSLDNDEFPRHLITRSHLSLDMIKYLIDLGADLELRNIVGETALIACARNCPVSVVRLLLEKGADVMAVNNMNETALHVACRRAVRPDKSEWKKDDIDLIELLIEAGSDLDAKDGFFRMSCLLIAIEHYRTRPEVTEVLLRGGADLCGDPDLGYFFFVNRDLGFRINRQCLTIARATKIETMFSESGSLNSVEGLKYWPADGRSHAIILAGVKNLKRQLSGPHGARSYAEIPPELAALIDPLGSRPSAIIGLAPHLAVFGRTDGYVYNAIVKLTENLNEDQLVDLALVVSKIVEHTRLGCPVSESTVGRLVRKSIYKSWACDPADVLKNIKRGFFYHLFLKNNFRREASLALNQIEEYLFGKDGLVGGLEAILDSFTITQRDMLLKRRLYAPINGEDRRIRARQEPEDGA